jgi:hypothetical protein
VTDHQTPVMPSAKPTYVMPPVNDKEHHCSAVCRRYSTINSIHM